MPSEERDAEMLGDEDREWIADWRAGAFDSGSRDENGWPIEMHGLVQRQLELLDERDALVEVAEATRELQSLTMLESGEAFWRAIQRQKDALDNLDAALGGGRNG